ncbi:receptor-interacting serine/threonine-protein kinase 2-like isoform X2 [Pyxicephalus adspersus]|uniref:receptor-interacting serine/threonine-protein kinase 2-like isoform X2 n=1 Tax=Pyxicephalus adspersus TaxID=30357 RepID=UPI003B59748D
MSLPLIRQNDLKSFSVVDTSTEKVYKSIYEPTLANVLIKLLSLSGLNDRSQQMVLNHIDYINKIKSEYLTQLVGIYRTPHTLGILTQWMTNGSLHSLIYQRDLYPLLPLSVCIRILRDVAEGLTFLHNLYPPIMHQRLKPCNILLDGNFNVKLSDVQLPNLPKHVVSSDQDNSAHRIYLSPQRLQGHEPTLSDDIYSLGIIMHEVLTRKCPFHEQNPLKLETLILRGYRPQASIDDILKTSNLPQSQRKYLIQFINLCWHQNPRMRPTAAECLSGLRNIMQSFSVEDSKREMDSFVNKKDSWLTSQRNRTLSAPEEGSEVSPVGSGKKEKRSDSFPGSFPWNGSHVLTTEPHPRKVHNNVVSWTHVEPRGHSTQHYLSSCSNCVEMLKKHREVLLNSITEGQLNQLIDTMRSKFILSRGDAENINAEQTLKARIRKYMDTCCNKGEEAARMALDILLSRKILWINPNPAN